MTLQPAVPANPRWFATGAPPQIKAMMLLEDNMGKLAIEAVNTQISLYNASVASAQKQRNSGVPSLFDTVAHRIGDILGEDPVMALDAISELAEPIARRAIWKWEKLPYAVLRAGRKLDDGTEKRASWTQSESILPNVDEWIIQHEKWLRFHTGSDEWKGALVNFFTHAGAIFDDSTLNDSSRKIIRPNLSGFYLLDHLRLPEVEIQPSLAAFREKFAHLTNNQLRGLDWSNIFVAGGMVLGTMLTIGNKQPALSESSDIDVYIYGLRPQEANDKIEHLFTTFKSNLPPSAEVLVVRNSKTITFISQFPLRRLQIVLKLVMTPLDVLLSFDLDICAMGFDGQDVWMLPRAARALETGYNVFTMDMIQGHYLAERRATQEQRVFKYAYKGYGIRILPSYIESLSEGILKKKIQRGREWVNQVVQTGKASRRFRFDSNGLPTLPHYAIDLGNMNTYEPGGRSCLTGLELFCRHVALWEAEQAGELVINSEIWSSTSYEDQVSAYNDSPRYKWDANFTLEELRHKLLRFNRDQVDDFLVAVIDSYHGRTAWLDSRSPISRSTFGDHLRQVMSPRGHIKIPVLVPQPFFNFANQVLVRVLEEKGFPVTEPLVLVDDIDNPPGLDEIWVFWTIDQNTMWQQLDRRIDEVYEVLWSLRHANSIPGNDLENRINLFRNQISRRSIRKTPADELGSFAQWVARAPSHPEPDILREIFGAAFEWEDDRTA